MLTAAHQINLTATKVLQGKAPIQVLSLEFPSAKLSNELSQKYMDKCNVH